MTKIEQANFVEELCFNVTKDLIANVHRVPENWDGHQLRVWIAERFEAAAHMSLIRQNGRSKLAKDYRNDVLVLDLD